MIDKSAFHKAMGSLIYTILRPISEEKQHKVLEHEVAAHLAKLAKLMNKVTAAHGDPTKVPWEETIAQLGNTLKPGGVCKDETIRLQALKELDTVQAFFSQTTAKPKAAPVHNNTPKASL